MCPKVYLFGVGQIFNLEFLATTVFGIDYVSSGFQRYFIKSRLCEQNGKNILSVWTRPRCFLHDCPPTWEHCVLECFLSHNADQPIQQRGHGWAQIPEKTWLPHQAVLLPALAKAAPWCLERTWKIAVVFLCKGSATRKSSVFTSLYVKGVLSLCKTECGF